MTESSLRPFALGAFMAAAGILLGAFGAHALSGLSPGRLAWWHTATQYLFLAAFGVMLHGLFERAALVLRSPVVALVLGALLFSGSLYAMALGAPRWLGMVTPLGGLSLTAGFVWMGLRAFRPR
jgi:uncharacterized membrane protein YgdD (TMEM256/DUF423 family)